MLSAVMGRLRTRLPFSLAKALAMAGATTATAGSPMPPGFSVLLTKMMSMAGESVMRGNTNWWKLVCCA